MACTKVLTISSGGGDVPLDSAIYSSTLSKIVGVRNQWIYTFNATTGTKESEFRFVDDVLFGESGIVEVGSFFYVGVWRELFEDPAATIDPGNAISPHRDVFKINAALTTATTLGLGPLIDSGFNAANYGFNAGFVNLVTDGTKIYGYYLAEGGGAFYVDPTDVITSFVKTSGASDMNTIASLAPDFVNQKMWGTQMFDPGATGANILEVVDIDYNNTFQSASSNDETPVFAYGICVVPTANPVLPKVYAVTGTNRIVKADVATAYSILPDLTDFPSTSLFILEAAAKPMRIRYNPADGLVYIPTWANNTVEVLNPATDTITSVKTGFNTPVDCVFTPTKKFAVQNSSVGLREIV